MNRRTIAGNWTLIGTMLSIAIVAILMAVFMRGWGPGGLQTTSPRKDGKGTTIPGLVKADAQDQVCRSNLQQIRESIQVAEATDTDSGHPASLQDLKLPAEILRCPIGHELYVYDPATGTVHCPHPGHEKF